MTKNIAVVVMNMGGPSDLKAVRPYLFNIFMDKAMSGLNYPSRLALATLISTLRTHKTKHIYSLLNGKSPIVENTQAQLNSLVTELQKLSPNDNIKGWQIMRYWHPRCRQVMPEIMQFNPAQVALVPLYPQFSTSTSASSIREFKKYAKAAGLPSSLHVTCCYPQLNGFISASQELLMQTFNNMKSPNPVILFSAHGLPKKLSEKRNDPYLQLCQLSCQQIMLNLPISNPNHILAFQSRVGKLEWLKPYVEDVIAELGKQKKSILLYPVSFVSEHSETLVELQLEYKQLALDAGVQEFAVVPTVSAHKNFISDLAKLTFLSLSNHTHNTCGFNQSNPCPKNATCCPINSSF